jgi:hypothetical protein
MNYVGWKIATAGIGAFHHWIEKVRFWRKVDLHIP